MRIMGRESAADSGASWSLARSAARSLPEGNGLRTGGIGRAAGLRQSPPHALRRRCGNSHRNLQRHAMGYALGQRLACFLRPISCTFAPFPATTAMSAASPFVRTGVIMPHRNSCAKRACPASISHGAGLPYPWRELATGITPRRFTLRNHRQRRLQSGTALHFPIPPRRAGR